MSDIKAGAARQDEVDEWATVNVKDFQDMGFAKVWNPLAT